LSLSESKRYFEKFLRNILAPINRELSERYALPENDQISTEVIASILREINRFMYTQTEEIARMKCATPYGEVNYFSEYHKFWEENHKAILGIHVDEEKCREVAEKLEEYYHPFSPSSVMDVEELEPQKIADARLFIAIQDFGFGLPQNYYELARRKPYLFDARELLSNPNYINEMLTELGVADYQPDKRIEWIRRCAELLVNNYNGTAYNIAEAHNYDAVEIRKMLVNAGIGIDVKKADMFLRDMQEFGVWNLRRFEEVSVAPDMNTMRIALRTGIVHVRMPLLSSFMDVFCYQYNAVSGETNKAWRKVWEIWRAIPNNHAVSSPAYIDFLIYNMGRKCCKAKKRRCEVRCSSREQRKCIIKKLALTECDGWCIFKDICDENRKKLNPPKSISIFGRYGWTTSYSDEGGGLGLRC